MTNQAHTASNKDILKWISENKIHTNKGNAIEFRDHGFLLDIMQDSHNKIVVRKSTQVGASFSVTIKMLHLGSQGPFTFIYTLPTSTDAKNFVLSKFDPVVERSPGLLASVAKLALRNKVLYNSVMKRIGESYFMFRGSWSAHGAQSIDADVMVVDELDFQKPEIREMWEERTSGSGSLDIIWWIGYPSIPGFGIEQLYENSDKRNWFIQCPHCKTRQTMIWPDSICFKREIFQCLSCSKEITDEARRSGLWKITDPSKDIHGYYINKMMAPWISATKIIDRFKKDTPKKFFNYTLGLPYINKESELTDQLIADLLFDEEEYASVKADPDTRIIMGIDQGDIFHTLIALVNPGGIHVVEAKEYRSEDEMMAAFRYFKPDLVIMDMFPNRHTAKKFCDEYGSEKFFMAKERNWSEGAKNKDYWKLDRGVSEVGIERTESLDEMIDMMMNGLIKFRRSGGNMITRNKQNPGVIDMIRNLVPDVQERHGRPRRIYKAVGPDHYGHSLNFVTTAAHILFPSFRAKEFVASSSFKTETPKTWYQKDFESRTRSLISHNTLIIEPNGKVTEVSNNPFEPLLN